MGIKRAAILFRQREMMLDEERKLGRLRETVKVGAAHLAQVLETYPMDLQSIILAQVETERALRYLACQDRLRHEDEAWALARPEEGQGARA